MKAVTLGKNGPSVSAACLGTMLMGTVMGKEESFRTLDHYTEKGGNFLDTANCYAWWVGHGAYCGDESESVIGEWMRERKNRDRVFLATKCGARITDIASIYDSEGNPRFSETTRLYERVSRKAIMEAVEGSLKRLGTDYIDLYYVHVDDRKTPLEETLGALNELVGSGTVRAIGWSNVRTWRLERIRSVCEKNGWTLPVAVQQEYSFLRPYAGADLGIDVHADEELFDWLSENRDVTMIAYSPLLKGIYADEKKRRAYYNWRFYDTPDSAERLGRLEEVSKKLGVDGNTLVLAWILHHKPSVIPILGGSGFDQYRMNLAALDVTLDRQTMDFLDGKNPS